MDFDFHIRAELSGLSRDAMSAQQLDEAIYQRFGDFGQGGVGEGGTASLAGVGVQSELRNDNGFAFYVQYREIGFTLVILEDSQIGGFFCEEGCLLLPISVTDTQ